MTPLSAFLHFLLPAMIAAAGLFGLGLCGRRRDGDAGETHKLVGAIVVRAGAALVAALAFWPADVALNQWHRLWPIDGTNRFLAVAVGAAAFGALHSVIARPAATGLIRLGLGGLIALSVLTPLDAQYMPRGLLVVLAATSGVWLAVAGGVLDAAHGRAPRGAAPGALIAGAACAAPGLFETGYAGGAQLAGTLASIAGGLLAVLLVVRVSRESLGGAHTVWLSIFAAVLLVTYGYLDEPAWWPLLVMGAAPLGAACAFLPLRWWARLGFAIVAGALIGGGASLGALAARPAADPSDSYYG